MRNSNASARGYQRPSSPKPKKAKKVKTAKAADRVASAAKTVKGKSSPSSRSRGGALVNRLLDQAVGRVKNSMNKKR